MALTLFSLLAKLGIDTSDYTKGLDDAVKHADKSGSSIVRGLATAGAGVVAGLGVAAAATGAFLVTTIGPASDLAETVSKVGVVFGEQGDAVLAWADDAATAMGMTRNAALGAAGTYGNLFRAMGMTEDTSADMSTSLVGLAADLASFNNMDPTAVLDKLRAGLSGETEPLKALGVNINAALLEQKAFEMGLWDGEGALTAAAKAQASYALIMEQTSLAQGDFARTSEGLANQQRITDATMGGIKETLGTALLPAMTALQSTINKIAADPAFQEFLQKAVDALGAFATKVIENIPVVIDTFQKVASWLSDHEGVLIGILVALGAAVTAFVYLTVAPAIAGLIALMSPVILPILAISAAVALLYEAWENDWGGIRTTLKAVWEDTLKPIFEQVKQWLGVNIPVAIDALTTAFNWVKVNVLEPIAGAFDNIGEAIQKVIGWVGTVGEKLASIKDKLPDWLVPGSPTPFELGLLGIADALGIVEQAQSTAFSAMGTRGAEGIATSGFGGGVATDAGMWSNPGGVHGLPEVMLDLSNVPDVADAIVEAFRRRRSGENEEGLRAEAPVRDIHLTINAPGATATDIQIGVQRGLGAMGIRVPV